MIVLDTSGLIAALDADQRHHDAARQVLDSDPGPRVLSPFVLAELDYLVSTRIGVGAELELLRDVSTGAYTLDPFGSDDVAVAAEILERHRDLGIGLADASIVVLAARHRTRRILTLDERHFRAVRPLRGRAFEILPTDA